jgi:hypothetical protein
MGLKEGLPGKDMLLAVEKKKYKVLARNPYTKPV